MKLKTAASCKKFIEEAVNRTKGLQRALKRSGASDFDKAQWVTSEKSLVDSDHYYIWFIESLFHKDKFCYREQKQPLTTLVGSTEKVFKHKTADVSFVLFLEPDGELKAWYLDRGI